MEEAKEMEIKELLMQSSNYVKSAFAIESSLKECKTTLLYRLFSALEQKLAENGMHKVAVYDYEGDRVVTIHPILNIRMRTTFILSSTIRTILINS